MRSRALPDPHVANRKGTGEACMRLLRPHGLSLAALAFGCCVVAAWSGLKQLRWLTVPSRMDDRGMALIAGLPALTGLYFKENLVTNAGLTHLAKRTSLEELELGSARITDAAKPGTIGFHVWGEFPSQIPRPRTTGLIGMVWIWVMKPASPPTGRNRSGRIRR